MLGLTFKQWFLRFAFNSDFFPWSPKSLCGVWVGMGHGLRKVRSHHQRNEPGTGLRGPCSCLVKKQQAQVAQATDSLQDSLLHTSSTFIVLITILSAPYLEGC